MKHYTTYFDGLKFLIVKDEAEYYLQAWDKWGNHFVYEAPLDSLCEADYAIEHFHRRVVADSFDIPDEWFPGTEHQSRTTVVVSFEVLSGLEAVVLEQSCSGHKVFTGHSAVSLRRSIECLRGRLAPGFP